MRALIFSLVLAGAVALAAAGWIWLSAPGGAATAFRTPPARPLVAVSAVPFPTARRAPAVPADPPKTELPPTSPPPTSPVPLPPEHVADFAGPDLPPWLSERVATGASGFSPGRGDRVSLGFGRLRLTAMFAGRGGAVVSEPLAVVPGHCLTVAQRTRVHPGVGPFSAETVVLSGAEEQRLAAIVRRRDAGGDAVLLGGPANTGRAAARWDTWSDEVVTYDPRGSVTLGVDGAPAASHPALAAAGAVRVGFAARGADPGSLYEVDTVTIRWVPCPAAPEGAR